MGSSVELQKSPFDVICVFLAMANGQAVKYPGTSYHVMNRGNRSEGHGVGPNQVVDNNRNDVEKYGDFGR